MVHRRGVPQRVAGLRPATPVPPGDPDGRDAWLVRADDGRSFAVFAVDGALRVTDAVCPHNQGALERHPGECETAPRFRLGTYPVVDRAERLRAHSRGE